jgi:hypothetical protein
MFCVGVRVFYWSPLLLAYRAAITKGILWAAVIAFLKSTMVDFAVFVGGVVYVVRRLAAFLTAVAVILLAFAQMFYFVYVETDMCQPATDFGFDQMELQCRFPHCTFEDSLMKVYTMMMGEIGDETRYATNLVAQILFVAYALLVVILLSNVLIAIVTDSYEIIQNDRAAIVFWSNRLDFVAEMDAITYGFHTRSCARNQDLDEEGNLFVKDSLKSEISTSGEQQEESPQLQRSSSGRLVTSEVNDSPGKATDSDPLEEGWRQVMLLFDESMYDEFSLWEFWVYMMLRFVALVVVIPVWLTAGLATAGWLWPPQVRQYLFMQRETTTSRAELERQKLEKLQKIHIDLKNLKSELFREMELDRADLLRTKTEVETVQSEVLTDLQEVKNIMMTLLER